MTEDRIIPPRNTEVEAALLSAIIVDNGAYDRVAGVVKPEYFFEPVHGRIFEACAELINRGEVANANTLSKVFDHDEALNEVNGGEYLYALQDSVITIVEAKTYARLIREYWQRRELLVLGTDLTDRAQQVDLEVNTADLISSAEEDLHRLAGAEYERGPTSAGDNAFSALQRAQAAKKAKDSGQVVGLSTGIKALDSRIGGLNPGLLYIVAGATSQGKSALAGTIADNICKAGGRGLFVSLEMPGEDLAKRSLARLTGVSVTAMDRGTVTDADMRALADAGVVVQNWNLETIDNGDINITEVRSQARRLHRANGLDYIIVDYLQLLHPPTNSNNRSRVEDVGAISRGLKSIAMELGVPVVALAQLSRAVDQRDDKTPRLSDLRESGSIEQDADVIIFVYREEQYLKNQKPPKAAGEDKFAAWLAAYEESKGRAELIVAKQRQGATGRSIVRYDAQKMRFLDREDEPKDSQETNTDLEAML